MIVSLDASQHGKPLSNREKMHDNLLNTRAILNGKQRRDAFHAVKAEQRYKVFVHIGGGALPKTTERNETKRYRIEYTSTNLSKGKQIHRYRIYFRNSKRKTRAYQWKWKEWKKREEVTDGRQSGIFMYTWASSLPYVLYIFRTYTNKNPNEISD